METQEFAYIPEAYQEDDLRWVRISPDPDQTKGVFLLLYHDLSQGNLYDYWFENLAEAHHWAEIAYGIMKEDWKTRESLENDGIQIIDEI